jgi:CDP-paratose 2-epimerase
VRDILYVEDLLNAYDAAIDRIDQVAGSVYNIGGGHTKTISIWMEFAPLLEKLIGKPIPTELGDWRPGDQPVYVSDIAKAGRELGWKPQIDVNSGITRLYQWVSEHKHLFA